MTTVMAHQLVNEMFSYCGVLKNREAKDGLHIVYEDEYEKLKKMYDDASEAVTKIPGPYTKARKNEIDDLCEDLDIVDVFLYDLVKARKTD